LGVVLKQMDSPQPSWHVRQQLEAETTPKSTPASFKRPGVQVQLTALPPNPQGNYQSQAAFWQDKITEDHLQFKLRQNCRLLNAVI